MPDERLNYHMSAEMKQSDCTQRRTDPSGMTPYCLILYMLSSEAELMDYSGTLGPFFQSLLVEQMLTGSYPHQENNMVIAFKIKAGHSVLSADWRI